MLLNYFYTFSAILEQEYKNNIKKMYRDALFVKQIPIVSESDRNEFIQLNIMDEDRKEAYKALVDIY